MFSNTWHSNDVCLKVIPSASPFKSSLCEEEEEEEEEGKPLCDCTRASNEGGHFTVIPLKVTRWSDEDSRTVCVCVCR